MRLDGLVGFIPFLSENVPPFRFRDVLGFQDDEVAVLDDALVVFEEQVDDFVMVLFFEIIEAVVKLERADVHVVDIGAVDVDQVGFDERHGGFLDGFAEAAGDRTCGDLGQRAVQEELAEALRFFDDALVAFGVRDDRHVVGADQLLDDWYGIGRDAR